MSWNDLEPHPRLSENVSLTECHGKFKPVGEDFEDRLGSPAHFTDRKTEAHREGPHPMQLTRTGIGRCRFDSWASGLPAQAASVGSGGLINPVMETVPSGCSELQSWLALALCQNGELTSHVGLSGLESEIMSSLR